MRKTFTILWQHGTIALLCASMIAMTACTVDQVLSDIDIVLQTSQQIESAIGAISPADAAILEGLTGLAITGLQAIQKDYDAYESSKSGNDLQKVVDAVQALQTNLPQNLAAAHIYSPNVQAKCAAWVNLVVTTLQAISAQIAPSASTAITAHAATVALPTPSSLQARWVTEVCSGDSACGAKVKVHQRHRPFKL
jgi:hypothetical protein